MTLSSPTEPRFITVTSNGECKGFGNCASSRHPQHRTGLRRTSTRSREQCVSIRTKLDNAIRELIETRGDAHPDLLLSLVTLGNACSNNGDYEDAIRYYQQALPLNRKLHGVDHHKVGDNLVSMAMAMESVGRFEEGMEALEGALKIYKVSSVRTNSERKANALWFKVVNVLNQIGNIYFRLGMIDVANEKYHDALKASGQSVTDRDVNDSCLSMHVADILNNIASVRAITKDFEESISMYNSALELQMDVLGEDDPAVAITLNNIGTMNFHAKKYEVALKSYKQVLKMRRDILGRDHLSVSDALVNVAIVYKKKREYDRSERALEEALRIVRKHFDEETERTADIYVNFGLIAQKRGDTEGANNYFSDALHIYENMDDDHPTVEVLHTLLKR